MASNAVSFVRFWPRREVDLPEDVRGVLELGGPFGLAAVATSREFSHDCSTDWGMVGRMGVE